MYTVEVIISKLFPAARRYVQIRTRHMYSIRNFGYTTTSHNICKWV